MGDNRTSAWHDADAIFLAGERGEQVEQAWHSETRYARTHTDRASPGSVVYQTESEGFQVLFAQDVHGPLDPTLLSGREDYFRSLNHLISLEADILCEGHYGVYKAKERVRDFISSFLP